MIGVRLRFFGFALGTWLSLAWSAVAIAKNDYDPMLPSCERQSPNDIHFNLSDMGLQHLRRGFITGNLVTCIDLSRNSISRLEKGAFDGLPGLRYLNLARNSLPSEALSGMHFPSLRGLMLDGFTENPNAMEQEDHRVQQYSSDSNDYEDRSDSPFTHRMTWVSVPSLEKLSFRYHTSATVNKFLRTLNALNLTQLHLGSNELEEILLPEKLTESITQLNVDDNRIHLFALSLPKLRYLSINRNAIRHLCIHTCDWNSLSVSALPALETLLMANNQIENIEANAFEKTFNLKTIDLTGNSLYSLPANLFGNVTLRNLTLTRNRLRTVPDICDLRELELIDLGTNQVDVVNEESFCNLTHLRTVILSVNQLTSIPDGTFGHLPELKTLDLSRNRLTMLAPNWIGSDRTLINLKLNDNAFNDVGNMSLGVLASLGHLDISGNPLRVVTVNVLANLPPETQINVCGTVP